MPSDSPSNALIAFIIFCISVVFEAREKGLDVQLPKNPEYVLNVYDCKGRSSHFRQRGEVSRLSLFRQPIIDGLMSNGISPEAAKAFAAEFLTGNYQFKSQSLQNYVEKAVCIGTDRLNPKNQFEHKFDPRSLKPLFVFARSSRWDWARKQIKDMRDQIDHLRSRVVEFAESCELFNVRTDICATIDLIVAILHEFYPEIIPSHLWLNVLFKQWHNLDDMEYLRCILRVFSRENPCIKHRCFIDLFSRLDLRMACHGIRLDSKIHQSILEKIGLTQECWFSRMFMVFCSKEEKEMYRQITEIYGDNWSEVIKRKYAKYKRITKKADNEQQENASCSIQARIRRITDSDPKICEELSHRVAFRIASCFLQARIRRITDPDPKICKELRRKVALRFIQARIRRVLNPPIDEYIERVNHDYAKVVQAFLRKGLAMKSELVCKFRFEIEKKKSNATFQAVAMRLKVRKLLDLQAIARQKLQNAARVVLAKRRIRAATIASLYCKVCFNKPGNQMVIYECGHYACKSCSDRMLHSNKTCHICRKIVKVHLIVLISQQPLNLNRNFFPDSS